MSGVLLEGRSFRPFKSSEEYLYAMKEDLAEWFQTLYPHLRINVDNFLDRLETGVALCEHANAVKTQAAEYINKKQARMAAMTRSTTTSLSQAQALIRISDVKFFPTAKPSTFFARDNVSNFIHWCRTSLQIIECLLFESDDLIMRKNEKHVILCLLEVARRGAKFGMLAPMLVQMERQIDREIAADQRKLGNENEHCIDEDSDSELEDEQPVMMYGPCPQIVTNDLKSLDEMVRDLVEKCTCPTQFPMIRVSEGKYRIGDTKVLIFVRILRNHVMVRVGGGWDTLSHYLDKHDPCRCRSQHRTTQGAKLVNKPGAPDLSGAQVYYDRSPPRVPTTTPTTASKDFLGPPMNSLNRSRSRSPSHVDSRRSVSPNFPRKSSTLAPPPSRSRSPTPNYTSTAKLTVRKTVNGSGPQSLPCFPVKKSKAEGDLTDHSDNASEVSDEGYRSLGIVHNGEKARNRASVYSQNSFEDVDENDHQESLDDDETNDCGLRRTQFSQRIYQEVPQKTLIRSHSAEKPQTVTTDKTNRSNSSDRSMKPPKNKTTNKSSNNYSNTWNGRQRSSRPSLNDVFSRASPLRQSTSSICHEPTRRVSYGGSKGSSPTKGRLRQELLKTVRSNDSELEIVQKVQALLKEYDGLGVLEERVVQYSPRKDSRPENHVSRIPAPVSHKA